MSTHLTEQEKFSNVYRFIREKGIRLRVRQVRTRKDPHPNGNYYPGRIYIYCTDRNLQISEITAALIHEYGHHIGTLTVSYWGHTENQAWDFGEAAFPADWLPNDFTTVKERFLDSYRTYENRKKSQGIVSKRLVVWHHQTTMLH